MSYHALHLARNELIKQHNRSLNLLILNLWINQTLQSECKGPYPVTKKMLPKLHISSKIASVDYQVFSREKLSEKLLKDSWNHSETPE